MIPPGSIIGIIGGGQLGKMAALAAANLGYKVHIFTPERNSPASHVAYKTTIAEYSNRKALKAFAENVDVITFEFENIPFNTLKFLEEVSIVRPNANSLHISQNRLREKSFVRKLSIPTADFYNINSLADLKKNLKKIGKAILKTAELGYDGKGQYRISSVLEAESIWKSVKKPSSLILEKFVPFQKEVSVIIARTENGKSATFPVTENVHKNGILDESTVPSAISSKTAMTAASYAKKIANELDLVGLLAIEFFVLKNGKVLFNEMAPRPHNSGHWTMDACKTSQFEQFIRAVCGLPLGSVKQTSKVKMKNLIGNDILKWKKIVKNKNAKIHIYGKDTIKPGRKMGHINFIEK